MEKKKAVPQPSLSFEGSSSDEEDENEEGFVRSDREAQKTEDRKAKKAEEDSESEEEDDDDDDDEDDNEIDGTQRVKADQASSSEDDGKGDFNSDSETTDGKPSETSHQFVVLPRKTENANGHSGKKASTSEMSLKLKQKPEASPRKGKDMAAKRGRDEPSVLEKASSKKQRKESSALGGKNVENGSKEKESMKVSKDKKIPTATLEKKNDFKKSAHVVAEKVENASAQKNSAKKSESSSAKKAAVGRSKNDQKSEIHSDTELAKGPLSPGKPKLFTGKDEIVLTSEILHDLQRGIEIPSKREREKSDAYWSGLADRVDERMEGSWSKEQLCGKLKRMKVRYTSMAEKFNSKGERKFRHTIDKELFAMWDEIWGNEDAAKVDDAATVKNKQFKALAAASTLKGDKAPSNKVAPPVHDAKVVMEESKVHKDERDTSDSEESNEGSESPKKLIVTPKEVDIKGVQDRIFAPENNADDNSLHSVSKARRVFQEEVRATLAEIQESSKQTLKDWKTEALVVVESAAKIVTDQARITNGFGAGGFDGLYTPFRSLDTRELPVAEGNHALQQQWYELRMKELDIYRERLELMQRECQVKQDQMKVQLQKKK